MQSFQGDQGDSCQEEDDLDDWPAAPPASELEGAELLQRQVLEEQELSDTEGASVDYPADFSQAYAAAAAAPGRGRKGAAAKAKKAATPRHSQVPAVRSLASPKQPKKKIAAFRDAQKSAAGKGGGSGGGSGDGGGLGGSAAKKPAAPSSATVVQPRAARQPAKGGRKRKAAAAVEEEVEGADDGGDRAAAAVPPPLPPPPTRLQATRSALDANRKLQKRLRFLLDSATRAAHRNAKLLAQVRHPGGGRGGVWRGVAGLHCPTECVVALRSSSSAAICMW